MTSSSENNFAIKIFLLDDDPLFRLGIFTALENEKYADLQILAQTEIAALPQLLAQEIPDLLLLSIDLNRYPELLSSTFILSQQLHNKYPNLLIFLLTPLGTNKTIEKMPAVKGCCPKDIDIDELVKALRICAQGGTYFQGKKLSLPKNQKIGGWLYNQCKFGLKKVEHDLDIITNYITNNPLSAWDLLFWKGRKRELIAVRWLVYQLIPSDYDSLVSEGKQEESDNIELIDNNLEPISSSLHLPFSAQSETQNSFNLTLAKIKSSLQNCTDNILEIDILNPSKKKELLIIVINQLKRILEELNVMEIEEQELKERKLIILKDLWQSSTIKFLSRYYQKQTTNNDRYSLVDLILQESPILDQESLINIPFVDELLAYWVLQKDLEIDNVIYFYNDKNSQEIEEIFLQNLVLNIGNAIMQFILNSFSDYESIRYNLYDREWKSSRKIALFRNNLTWKYRQEKYWENPKNIFEDQYKVLKLDYKGIITGTITHPRHQELSILKGLPWFMTIAIEFRDGIAKVVKGIGDIIGKSLVYILTEVIGKGIGLIGKGILQGIGKKIKS
jgi:hypothetical protein